MRNPALHICENKGTAADKWLCSSCIVSTIPELPKFEILSLRLKTQPVCVRTGQKPEDRVSYDAAHLEQSFYS